ncbi:N-acetylglucosamine-binding protein GbpA [Shewanella marinintestina]|uniref:N-acetylglucosamine-binding protein GbpA n=1 Tax=Shewanella marinintestina TaxID=190305 RepID=UPI00200FD9C3|nr:N-acetylglucosamine-binding protein GbpA [Shewanella marinintestina]MCL1145134.1 N-acetylglucosamine-binding protein GbpA [Shewanella marinintestina]
MKSFPKKSLVALALASLSSGALAHGYVSTYSDGIAASRVALCKFPTTDTNQKNSNCGAIQYEPQSVEGPDGFPEAGPRDGKIASAQSALATALDEQTADRWIQNPIQSGAQTFEWTFTANHVTHDWKYYITKPDWNPNASLSRDSFDLTPFCVIEGNMVQPPKQVSHNCVVPEREGYQVILAVWDVGDTAASFYNVIDVKFDGQGPVLPDWTQAGQINPTMDLNIGDSVYTRVFDQAGENSTYRTELTISDANMGQAKNWTHALASKVNQQQTQLQAGQFNQGKFTPVYGANPVYIKAGSGIERVEVGYNIETPEPEYSLTVDGLEQTYTITSEPTTLELTLTAQADVTTELTVYNHHREPLASWTAEMFDGQNEAVALTLTKSEAGHHMLVTRIKDEDGKLVDQQTLDFHLEDEAVTPPAGDYDFVFPKGLLSYTAGTKVLATDGKVYQCKPFPYSGYCMQWTSTATQYQPAIGSHWQMAWDKLN